MNRPTPPPLLNQKFTLPKAVLIIWLVLFGLIIYLGVAVRNLDSRSLGELSGRFVGITLISVLSSWAVWRLSRRSAWVKSSVFLIVFILFTLDLLAGLSDRRREATSASLDHLQDQVRRVHQSQAEQFNQTGTITHDPQATDQIIATMKESASQGTALENKLMGAMADFVQKIKEAEAKHTEASEKLDSPWILEPTTPRSLPEIDALATSVTNFLQANQNFVNVFTNSRAFISEHLKAQGVPPGTLEQTVRGFEAGFKPQVPLVEKIREQDNEFGQALLQLLHLYKSDHGKWKWNEQSELAAFDNPSSNERWLDLITQINEIAEAQQQTQADLIKLRTKSINRPTDY